MTDTELVERWKMPARRDDVLSEMVPSDIRQLVGAIERQMSACEAAEAENTKLRKLLQRIINDLQQRADILKDGPRAERVVPLSDGVYMEALAALSKGDG